MNPQVQESLHNIVNTLNLYTASLQGYNELALAGATTWEDQRQAYDHWMNLQQHFVQYVGEVSALTHSLTPDIRVPVPAQSIVGIGILGVGIIYVNTTSMTGPATHPYQETQEPEFNSTGLAMCVGGLPDGTVIYTSIATYVLHEGQVLLMTQSVGVAG